MRNKRLSQEDRARRRICASFEEAEILRRVLGAGNKIYLFPMPSREVFVVAPNPYWASGLAGVLEGLLPLAEHIADKDERELLLELRQLEEKAESIKFKLKWGKDRS